MSANWEIGVNKISKVYLHYDLVYLWNEMTSYWVIFQQAWLVYLYLYIFIIMTAK